MNIVEKIIRDMPTNLNDLEKARYIYLKLGLLLNFSTKFNNTTDEMFCDMYLDKSDIEQLSTNQIICRSWARIYSTALSRVGVKNQIVDSGHQYVMFEYNGKIWNADATLGTPNTYTDLARIRYGDDTEKFGISTSQNLNNPKPFIVSSAPEMKEIEEIDKKFKFYQLRIQQFKGLSDKLTKLKESNIPTKEKLEFLFDSIGLLNDGYYESKDFVREMEYKYLSEADLKNINSVELKRTNRNYEVDIVQCIYVNDNENYSYYLLAPNLQIRKVDKLELVKLSVLGYGIGDKTIPGVDYPKNFVVGKRVCTLLKSILIKRNSFSSIISYDKEQIGKL